MRGDLVPGLIDPQTFEVQMRPVALDVVADAEGGSVAHPLICGWKGPAACQNVFN